jgi:hypothetical protein
MLGSRKPRTLAAPTRVGEIWTLYMARCRRMVNDGKPPVPDLNVSSSDLDKAVREAANEVS